MDKYKQLEELYKQRPEAPVSETQSPSETSLGFLDQRAQVVEQEIEAAVDAETVDASVGDVIEATIDTDSIYGIAYNKARIDSMDYEDENFNATEWVLGEEAEGLTLEQKDYIADNARNREHAVYMALRQMDVQRNREIQAERPWTTGAVMLGGGLVEGVGIGGAPKALHTASRLFKLKKITKAIEKVNDSRILRGVKGGAEGAAYMYYYNQANAETGGVIEMALLGSVLEGAFGRLDLGQVTPAKTVTKEGDVVTEMVEDIPQQTPGFSKHYTRENVDQALEEAEMAHVVATSKPKVKDQLEAIELSETTLKSRITKLDQEIRKVDQIVSTPKPKDAMEAPRKEGMSQRISGDVQEWIDAGAKQDTAAVQIPKETKQLDSPKVQRAKKLKASKEKQKAKLEAELKELETSKASLASRSLEDDVDMSPATYNMLAVQREKLVNDLGEELSQEYDLNAYLAPEKLQGARAYAEENQDMDMVQRIDRLLEKQKERSFKVNEAVGVGTNDAWVQDVGQLVSRSDESVREHLGKLVTSTQTSKTGEEVLSGADYHKEILTQKFSSETTRVTAEGYESFLKETNKNSVFRRFYARGSRGYRQFSADVVRYMHETSNNIPPAREFPQSIKDTGDALKKTIGDFRLELKNSGWDVPDVLDETKEALSRGRNDTAWLSAFSAVDEKQVFKVVEGALLKADPTMNLRFKLKDLEFKVKDKPELEMEIDALKKQIEEVKANPTLQAKLIDETLESSGGYSKTIAKAYALNQFDRSAGIVPKVNNTTYEGAFDVLENAHADTLAKLSQEEQALLKNALEYSKSNNSPNLDIFARRLDLDSTFRLTTKNNAGETVTMVMEDFFSDDLDAILFNTINLYSSAAALGRVGVRNFDEFDSLMEQARQSNKHLKADERKRNAMVMDQIDNYFRGTAQYDDTGNINTIKRTLKKFITGARLGYLPLSMMVELSAVATRNGLPTALSYMPMVLKSLKELGTMSPQQSGLMRAIIEMGMESMNPFYNYAARAENGIYQAADGSMAMYGADLSQVSTKFERFLSRAENIAATTAHTFMAVSKPVDIIIRRLSIASTLDSLVNIKPSKLKSQRMKDIGVDEAFVNKELPLIRRYIKIDGKRIVDIDHEGLRKASPEIYDSFITKVVRIADRQVQTNRFGQMPPLINTQLFSWFGQFKSFALGTYNNQFKYDLSIRDTEAMLTHTVQTIVGMAAAYSREAVKAELEGRENRMKDMPLEQLIVIGIRNGSAAALPLMVMDALYEGATGEAFLSPYSTVNQTAAPMLYQMGADVLQLAPQLATAALDPNTDVGRKQVEELMRLFVPHYLAVPASRGISEALDMPERTKGESIFDLSFE